MSEKFEICRMFSKDKNYEIVWDIAELKKNIDGMNFEIEYKDVCRLIEQTEGICTNPEYAMETDITKPCIIVRINGNVEIFIDGCHRLYKAHKLNVKTIPCYVLPTEFHKKFIKEYDSTIYEKVVDGYSTV